MLLPRQFRMINTGTQQSLGTTHPSKRTAQVVSQLRAGFMDAVGQIPFSMSLHIFHGIQFRRIARKPIDMQTRLPGQERLNFFASVNFSAIPNDKYLSPQMTQQLAQERNNLQPCDIAGMEPSVKSQPPSRRRNSQYTDNRYFVPAVAMPQDRSLTNGSPCPTDIGNQQKTALVKKSKMSVKPFGLFLYAARPAPSTGGSHPRPAATPAFQVSGSSNSTPGATASIRPRMYNEPHTAFQPVSQFVVMSTTLWCVQPPPLLSAISPADHPFVLKSGNSDVPSGRALSIPSPLSSDRFGSTGLRCSMTLSLHRPPRGKSSLPATKPMPGTDATLTVHGFHMVSCQHYSMYPLNVKEQ